MLTFQCGDTTHCDMATHRTARQRARDQITTEILDESRRQLADVGAAALSLRSIARELGMVSSGIYRYVESRDALLTQLIVAAYQSLGDAAEGAAERVDGESDAGRWVRVAAAIRQWAIERPHEFLLLYGSPVPGYAAPDTTIAPGTRATLVLIGIVRDAHAAGRLASPTEPGDGTIDAATTGDLRRLAELVDLDVSVDTLVAVLAAWTQLYGLVGFELTNQTRGIVTAHDELFTATARLGAFQIGLR